jgi:RNA polymerase sigma factor (sigma-70 family)
LPRKTISSAGRTGPGTAAGSDRSPRRCAPCSSVAELVGRAAAGDQRAWDAIVERYSGLVWSICRACGLNPADAAEVSQTTWLRLVQHLASLRDPERIGSWLSMTARREAWRIHRQSARTLPVEAMDQFETDEPSGDEVDRGLLDAERHEALREAFSSLPSRCQQVLRLLMSDPAPSYVEVAAALDMPVGSIGPTRGRCLACLRDRAVELTRG